MLHKIKKLIRKKSNINLIIKVIAVVMVRRGVRGILDKILFPDNPTISYITSIFLGIVILLIDNDKLDELSHH